MSVEKGVQLRLSHRGLKARSKQFRGPRGRSKARARGARSKACVRRRSPPEPYCKKEKVWAPWNGLIVIGKRVELLDRNSQKSKLWDPKLESEYWKLEGGGKTAMKDRSGLPQETLDSKLLHSAVRTLQDPASLGSDNSKEIWEPQSKGRVGTESEEMTEEPKSDSEEMMSKDKLGTTGGDLRSRGDQLRQSGDLRSSEEKLVYKRERRVSTGEKVDSRDRRGSIRENIVGNGEKRGSIREKVVDTGEKRGSIREKVVDSGERHGSIREKVVDSGERRRVSVREKVVDSGERRRTSVREKVVDSGERHGSIREKVVDSGERHGSIREKVVDSGEKRASIREKVVDSGERRASIREKVVDSGERHGSLREKVDSGERRRASIREKVVDSGERRVSIREKEKPRLSRERLRSSGEQPRPGGKDLRSIENKKSDTEEPESTGKSLEEHSEDKSVTDENVERVTVTAMETVMEITDREMEMPSESVEGREELRGEEEGMESDRAVLNEMEDTIGESVSVEEKENPEV